VPSAADRDVADQGRGIENIDVKTNRNGPGYGARISVSQPFLRNAFAFCLFGAAFSFAYRYGMAFSHATSSPFCFRIRFCFERCWWFGRAGGGPQKAPNEGRASSEISRHSFLRYYSLVASLSIG
jgi:hypothetical protein